MINLSLLITQNLVPLAFNDIDVKDYMSSMSAIYELQDINPLVDLYLFSYLRTCVAYDTAIKALGFDEVRVRFRQERRDLLRDIILGSMSYSKAHLFIKQKAENLIPEKHRFAFIEDVEEDLKRIDESHLVGLGVSPSQLKEWLHLSKR